MDSIWSALPNGAELMSALPVIFSLILIEGLLSVDNAMAIAAMASELPKNQQKLALRLGIIGAYLFRGLCLVLVAWIAGNPWLKILGAIYLLYLMCQHVIQDDEEDEHGQKARRKRGLLMTIIQIEIMDLSLSLDNVVAAVALDKRLWVVCTGVFIGILALRFVAGFCIKLIERFPVLKKTAFLLVGFVGAILLTEMTLEYAHIHFHINAVEKLIGIVAITAGSLWYSHTASGKAFLKPVVKVGVPTLRAMNVVLAVLMLPFVLMIRIGKWLYRLILPRAAMNGSSQPV